MDANKNPNLETTTKRRHHHHPPSSSQDLKRTTITNKNPNLEDKSTSFSPVAGGEDVRRSTTTATPPSPVEESGRERLKRHRVEMAGRVWIPEIWGQEDLLEDWIDCTVFDSSLGNNSIMSARTALVQEARSTVRIENRC